MKNLIILDANLNDGEGDILVTEKWLNLDGLLKADILQEWIGLLQKEYEIALDEMNEEFLELGAKE